MTDELNDLLTGPDEGPLERTEPETGGPDAEAARPVDAPDAPPQAVAACQDATTEAAPNEGAAAGPEGSEQPALSQEEGPREEDQPAAKRGASRSKPAKARALRAPLEVGSLEKHPIKKDWYILKVQSNREDSIADALKRRIAIEGQGDYFDEIIVPTEKVSEFKGGKKRVVKRKIYPGYIVVHMELNDDTWFLVRETPGIGDFTGSGGKPTPMLPHEVHKIVAKQEEKAEEEIRTVIPYSQGDRVRIKEGTFENFEGEVDNIDKANGRVTIMINIFGRSTPVELEYWQVEKL
ncbi:MAG TPA: transcription termination/antitermination protein NusG [Pirellulales bacterium]|nr:transcription termination/antitermination protein NusG [Pirellulales bacterium]